MIHTKIGFKALNAIGFFDGIIDNDGSHDNAEKQHDDVLILMIMMMMIF